MWFSLCSDLSFKVRSKASQGFGLDALVTALPALPWSCTNEIPWWTRYLIKHHTSKKKIGFMTNTQQFCTTLANLCINYFITAVYESVQMVNLTCKSKHHSAQISSRHWWLYSIGSFSKKRQTQDWISPRVMNPYADIDFQSLHLQQMQPAWLLGGCCASTAARDLRGVVEDSSACKCSISKSSF